jgi:hypothetical protein
MQMARCRDRAARWQAEVSRAATQMMAASPAEADAILEELEREIAAGPDFIRYRRADFKQPPKVNVDRNFVARVQFIARVIERKSWGCREKGKHGGRLGRAALVLLETLLYRVDKSGGYLCPCYDTLARLACMSRRSVITAMQVLQALGFVTIHRRVKRIQTAFGTRVVQDSNAYEYHPPAKMLGRLAWAVFGPSSECSKSSARKASKEDKESGYRTKAFGGAVSASHGVPQRGSEGVRGASPLTSSTHHEATSSQRRPIY